MKKDKFKPSLIGQEVTVSDIKNLDDVWVGKLSKKEVLCELGKVWYYVPAGDEGKGLGLTNSMSFTAATVSKIRGNRITLG